LTADQVHVWLVSLDEPQGTVEKLARILSDDERQRAGRYLRDEIRRRFVVGRARLRQLLGQYLHQAPERFQFSYTSLGKPFLPRSVYGGRIEFNLSNSRERALIALTAGGELGVDIEYIHPLSDHVQIARRYFAPEEIEALVGLPEARQLAAFFNGWTRKEAILKAVGKGLSFPLNRVVVTLSPEVPARLLSLGGDSPDRFRLLALAPEPGYVAALAAPGRTTRVDTWRFAGCETP
jgi:4'-phosphopantetheinyl transferase